MKKTLASILIVCILVTIFIPGNISFAKEIDEEALEVFLEELAGISEETRKAAADILRVYLNDEQNGIKDLKRDLNTFLGEKDIETIEKKGYTLDDVKRELDKLEHWSIADRMKLVDYIKGGNSEGIKKLIKDVESSPNNGGSNDSPFIGEGDKSPPPKEEPKKPENESAKEEKLLEIHFKDIENHKYKDDIIFLAQRGIIKGKTKEKFDPDGKLTRAEFTALIQRLLEIKPNKDKPLPFKDVKENSWYYEYVKAAFDNGIIEGTTPTTFRPNNEVTREQMVAIVIRILEDKNLLHTLEQVNKDLAMFKDSNQVSNWAKEYMFYGVKYGIIDGRDEHHLAPTQPATRGEAASIIKFLYDVIEN